MHIRKSIRVAVLSILCSAALGGQAMAGPPRTVSVPSGSLTDAVDLLARQYGVDVFYVSSDLHGLKTEGVSGNLDAGAAFRALLQGTQLIVTEEGNSILIAPKDEKIGSAFTMAGKTLIAQASDVDSTRKESASEPLDEVVVVGTRQERYAASRASLGRFTQDVLTTPRSIQVIPEQVLIDQQVESVQEALKNVAGLTPSDGFGGTQTDFLLRGFQRDAMFRNGMRLGTTEINQPPTQNIETIEVIKGPASVLFGQIEPGGLVNLSTKKPSYTHRGFAQVAFDDYGKRLATFDLTGPLTGETLAFRLNASVERTSTFRDFYEVKRDFLSPSMRWDPSEDTTVMLTYEYFTDNRPMDRGFVSLPDGRGGRYIPNNVPVSRRFGERFEERDSKAHLVEGSVQHRLTDNWRAVVNVLYRAEDSFDLQTNPTAVTAAGLLTRVVSGSFDREVRTFSANAQLEGNLMTGPLRHQLGIGVDYRDMQVTRMFHSGTSRSGFDIFNPVYGLLPGTVSAVGTPFGEERKPLGVYLQDQISLQDNLKVLLGGRYDDAPGEVVNAGVPTVLDKTKFTPQAGVLFQPTPATSLYASYSEGFNPVTTVDQFNRTFAPQESAQYEVGAKGELFDRRLILSSAIFQIEKDNIVAENALGRLELIGEVRSRGAELSATGEPIRGLNFIGSYAYTDTEILTVGRDQGHALPNVAKHVFRFWTSYEARQGKFAGLGGGVGVDYTSDRFGETNNTWSLGSYKVVDASLWYYLRSNLFGIGQNSQLRFGLNVKNLLDERYFPASGSGNRISIGQPRTFIGSIGVDF
ncbi:TonB-dependent siderophore receptor [Steroidobacter sp.]|uniref:TonB-dependent siderophore receptor n=1 Tax=Steroidobacter sp. TaxID=1978227 RepID=UPI001A509FF7|nr:TonB-dependent receptor [Steroidobacter sp.]MBL8268966.1 TonB-dependent receptor [Steroidobacter sp.]